jgi:hypothetical protein
MGKVDFPNTHYKPAKAALGERPQIKISYYSDTYSPSSNYAGVIMYHWRGEFKWKNAKKGHGGRAFYVAIQDTSKWPADAFKRAGEGRVHDYLFREIFGEEFTQNTASVGGFAVMNGEIKYSSVWLNMKSNSNYAHKWDSDGSKDLSKPEQELINYAIECWATQGKNQLVKIPDWLDRMLS